MDTKQEKTIIWIIIIVTVLLFSTIIVLKIHQEKKFSTIVWDYHGFQIHKEGLAYKTKIFLNENQFPVYIGLRSDPRDVENISLADGYQELLKKKQIYVTIEPETNLSGKTTLAALEIDEIIDNPFLYNIPVNSAMTRPYHNSTVMTCADVNQTVGVVWLRLGSETKISNDRGCIVITGVYEDDLIRAADRLVYTLLQVIQDKPRA